MMDLSVFLLLAILLSGSLAWLLFPRKNASRPTRPPITHNPQLAMPVAKHYAYFPQIRQALSAADTQYLMEAAPRSEAKRALRQRRAVARSFLHGLREDFSNLSRLGRVIAALSPSVSHEQETERLVLQLKFHLLCSLVWLRLSAGNLPLQQLEHLTGLVESLATRMDAAISDINALSAGGLSGGINA